jgi:hypothetical protein
MSKQITANMNLAAYADYQAKLDTLSINDFPDLVGKDVYYVKRTYGVHKVVSYNDTLSQYLLDLAGCKFMASVFQVYLLTDSNIEH